MADQDEPTTAQRLLRLALASAGVVAAGLLWLVLGSSSAAAAQLDEPLTPVVEAVAEATEPVVAPVREVAPSPADELAGTVDPVVDAVEDAVEATVPATPPLPPVATPLDPILDPILDPVLDPVLDPLPGLVPGLPDPRSPIPSPATDEEPADDGAAAARTVIGPAIPDADRFGRFEPDRPAVAATTPPASFEDRTSTAGDRDLPGSPAAPPSLASSNGTSASGGSSRGDPGQLAVLLAVAALALGSGRRVSWPPVDWRPLRFAALIERPG